MRASGWCRSLLLSLGVSASAAIAEPLQVVVVVHPDLSNGHYSNEWIELSSFESALAKDHLDAQVSVVICDDLGLPAVIGPVPSIREAFYGVKTCGNNDGVEQALVHLASVRTNLAQRVVVFAPLEGGLTLGRATAEMLGARAEHQGVPIHVVESGLPHDMNNPLVADLGRFLADPTMAGTHVSTPGRLAALRSGGRYHLRYRHARGDDSPEGAAAARYQLEVRRAREKRRAEKDPSYRMNIYPSAEERARAVLARAFGPRHPETRRDALDDLADGRRRPSEIAQVELPAALHGVALEPLLDAVFEFVDARRLVEAAYAADGQPAGTAGAAAAAAISAPPRYRPSRR